MGQPTDHTDIKNVPVVGSSDVEANATPDKTKFTKKVYLAIGIAVLIAGLIVAVVYYSVTSYDARFHASKNANVTLSDTKRARTFPRRRHVERTAPPNITINSKIPFDEDLGHFDVDIHKRQNTECVNPAIRREWRELSPAEQRAFIGAVNQLKQSPSLRNQPSRYDDFVLVHYENTNTAHNNPVFFPWHRKFIRRFEIALQRIDPSIVLPYWDWALDSQAPEQSPVFSRDTGLGGDGDGTNNACVASGPFVGWQANNAQPHCLAREFSAGGGRIQPWSSSATMANMINTINNYAQFHDQFEAVPHAQVHVGVGGDLSVMTSPNDPIFWLHHANVDRYWDIWQDVHDPNRNTYNGPSLSGNGQVSLADMMDAFGLPVASAMSTITNGLCYKYSASVRPVSSAQSMTSSFTTVQPNVRFLRRRGQSNSTDDDIAIPPPLDAAFIKRMKYNETLVRSVEAQQAKFINRINAFDSYVPPSVLAKGHNGAWAPVDANVWRFEPGTRDGDALSRFL